MITVTQRGWVGIENGALLALAQTEFDVFLTVDQHLQYQQNLTSIDLALILVIAPNKRFKTLLPVITEIKSALKSIKRGDFIRIGRT